ncbi:MAG: cobyric acid synthase, partial [Acidobacteriota bacterium]
IEGAGSPAEINLAHSDVTNLKVAVYAKAPALLVGDIDRGGVFASLLGTVMLLDDDQRETVKGFIINRMRGDMGLLGDGPAELQKRAFGIPTLGVIPWLDDIGLAEEDRLVTKETDDPSVDAEVEVDVDIAVIRFPRLANFDDLDPLAAEPGVRLRWVTHPDELATPDGGLPAAVILPGTKMTLSDLRWLRQTGLASAAREAARAGVQVVGICGGYQMLGAHIVDIDGVEAEPGSRVRGLGLLPVITRFSDGKATRQRRAVCLGGAGPLAKLEGLDVAGYEIHMGETRWLDDAAPEDRRDVLRWLGPGEDRANSDEEIKPVDGASDRAGRTWGVYLHGLFDLDAFRHRWLRGLGLEQPGQPFDRGAAYDRLADHVERYLDIDAIERLLWPEC